MEITADLLQLAARQHGLLTTQQLREAGVSRSAEATLIGRGALTRERRGVVAAAGAPTGWARAVAAVCMSVRGVIAASHLSAARLWDLRTRDDDREFTVPDGANVRVPGARIHRSIDFSADDITHRLGIPTTTIERTICDLGARLPDHEIQRIADHAFATGMTTASRLRAFVDRTAARGRPGIAAARTLLDRHDQHSALAESGPEVALARLCREFRLPQPATQHIVRVGGQAFRVDLAYPDRKIYLEFDGLRWHSNPAAIARDHRRQNALAAAGWLPLRFSWLDLKERPETVAGQIRRTLAVR